MHEEYDDLADAEVEDTVHCTVCGAFWVLGMDDGAVILDPPGDFQTAFEHGLEQVKLCPECVQKVVTEWKESLVEAGLCEHGVNDGDWCPDCNAEKEASKP